MYRRRVLHLQFLSLKITSSERIKYVFHIKMPNIFNSKGMVISVNLKLYNLVYCFVNNLKIKLNIKEIGIHNLQHFSFNLTVHSGYFVAKCKSLSLLVLVVNYLLPLTFYPLRGQLFSINNINFKRHTFWLTTPWFYVTHFTILNFIFFIVDLTLLRFMETRFWFTPVVYYLYLYFNTLICFKIFLEVYV